MKGWWVSLNSVLVGPRGCSWGLARVSHGKSHWSPTAANRSWELFDTRAEPEEILCRSQWAPRGCSGHPRGLIPLELGSELLHGMAPTDLLVQDSSAHGPSWLLNAACNPRANPQLQSRIWLLIYGVFPFTIILNRNQKEKVKTTL